jgi:hypothetical protein
MLELSVNSVHILCDRDVAIILISFASLAIATLQWLRPRK